jgi:hypothetical protein
MNNGEISYLRRLIIQYLQNPTVESIKEAGNKTGHF